MNFARHGAFFDEFLKERDTSGIYDLACLDIIPRLDIYRDDLITSDLAPTIRSYPKLNVEAVLLSHAHVDHSGHIALLDAKIPIMASPISIAILKAIRDSSNTKVSTDIPYMSIREPEFDGIYLSGSAKNYVSRDLACQSTMPEALAEFVHQRPEDPSKKATKNKATEHKGSMKPGKICCFDELKLSFKVSSFKMDHSIYGALAYVLDSENGSIAYTGDFRIGKRGDTELEKFIEKARDASTLIIEGTRAGREGDNTVDEGDVKENCQKTAEEAQGIVVADYSARNFERMKTFMEIARKTGRQLVITMKDAYALHAIKCADGPAFLDDLLVYSEVKGRTNVWERYLNGRETLSYVTANDVRKNLDGFILSFSFFDMSDLIDIRPDAGTYIYSSSEAHSEEQAIDFIKLKNWLDRLGLKSAGFDIRAEDGKIRPYFDTGFHTSGHAAKEDIIKVIDNVDPDVIIPVHTEKSQWFEDQFGGSYVVKRLNIGEKFEL